VRAGAGDLYALTVTRVFHLDPVVLEESRRAAPGDPGLGRAIASLEAGAVELLAARSPSVMDKRQLPPSGDRHDYVSLAPYWWLDPSRPDGLPYVRRDGERNPEASSIPDKPSLQWLLPAAHRLALAFFFTGRESYAARAGELIRVWFLDPATAMNPHLRYGQGVPGITEGRPEGVIDVRRFVDLVDAIGLLEGSASWSDDDQRGMVGWFGRYLEWLLTSDLGREEQARVNNHGSWFVAQASAIALFVGRGDVARTLLGAMRERIAAQVEPDGRQPAELRRTRSLHYSLFNLEAHFVAANLGRTLGLDLWDSGGLRAALDFLLPYVAGEAEWPYQQIDAGAGHGTPTLLHQAAIRWRNPAYGRVAAALRPDGDLGSLLYGPVM
jgi:alginate lyase